MNNREFVVRIVQPAEKPQPQKIAPRSTQPENEELKHLRKIFHVLGFTAISALGILLALNFFNLGFSVNDVMLIIGIPLGVGIFTSYVIF